MKKFYDDSRAQSTLARFRTTRFIERLSRSMVLGALCALILRFTFRLGSDDTIAQGVQRAWSTLSPVFRRWRSYMPELKLAGALLVVVVIWFFVPFLKRYVRSWSAGLVTLTGPVLCAGTLLIFAHRLSLVGLGTTLVSLFACESWVIIKAPTRRKERNQLFLDNLKFPKPDKASALDNWNRSADDAPIKLWSSDLIGRRGVVETLINQIYKYESPIVALHGHFGDGKSSVINLLRATICDDCILVVFSAWLPGSEDALASSLFRDIASACKSQLHVPALRRRSRTYARLLGTTVPYFSALRDIFPVDSQWSEIAEIRSLLGELPKPVVVLLDEVDRMQKDEVLTLLKILRGVSPIANVTFVCAYDDIELRRHFEKESGDYLEKFFPTTISLAAPDNGELLHLALARTKKIFENIRWFTSAKQQASFKNSIESLWADALGVLCTNFRKVGLLLRDIELAQAPVHLEVDPIDLICIEALRRFFPSLHLFVQRNGNVLANSGRGARGQWLTVEMREARKQGMLADLNALYEQIEAGHRLSARVLLAWMFPILDEKQPSKPFFVYRGNEDHPELLRRINDAEFFPLYFLAALPSTLYSNADFKEFIAAAVELETASDVAGPLQTFFFSLPPGDPTRGDFLWKLGKAVRPLKKNLRIQIALALSRKADSYSYQDFPTEAYRAVAVVHEVAKSMYASEDLQRLLEECITVASRDDFAVDLLQLVESKDESFVFSSNQFFSAGKIKEKFVDRMRVSYSDPQAINLSKSHWRALRVWGEFSAEDRRLQNAFWLGYIGESRSRLAQAVDILFPPNFSWSAVDPREFINQVMSFDDLEKLFITLRSDDLTAFERVALDRFGEMLKGNYYRGPTAADMFNRPSDDD